MKKRIRNFIFIATALLMTACGGDPTDEVITISTSFGDIKAILFDETPKHKDNFIKLAKEGQLDSTTFYRIIQEFMIQGGDVNAKYADTDPIDHTISAEINEGLFHRRGALAAARQPDQVNPRRESSGSQFYIVQGKVFEEEELTVDLNKLYDAIRTLLQLPEYDSVGQELQRLYNSGDMDAYNKAILSLRPACEERLGRDVSKVIPADRIEVYTTVGGAPWLDDQYTVFGQVVEGMDVVDKIASVPTRGDRAIEPVVMTVKVDELSRSEISSKYGITYTEE